MAHPCRPLPVIACIITALIIAIANAQSCPPSSLSPSGYPALQVASGFNAQLLATDLERPRSIVVDDRGQLIIAGSLEGIVVLVLDEAGCKVERTVTVVDGGSENYNHGLALSPDGKTLYASTSSAVYSWAYDSSTISTTSRKRLITGMSSGGHITRTLLIPRSSPDLLLVSRGSNGNLDFSTRSISSGKSMIRVFNIREISSTETDYSTGGTLLGWGLRNSVGLADNPGDGGIWSVENSADSVRRYGEDFHEDNPGEELNFHGIPSEWDLKPDSGPNFGYPDCFTASTPSAVPRLSSSQIGTQFALSPNATFTDAVCSNRALFTPPRLTLPAHTAPLGIVFNTSSHAFIAFHGSWNRDDPIGYNVGLVEFDAATGQPVQREDSAEPFVQVLWNRNVGGCPGKCFRPTAVAVGKRGEVYVAADTPGDLWVLRRGEGGGGSGGAGDGEGDEGAAARKSVDSFAAAVALVAAAMVYGVL